MNTENEVYTVSMSLRVINEHNENDQTGAGVPTPFVEFVRHDANGNTINSVLFPLGLLKDTVSKWIEIEKSSNISL